MTHLFRRLCASASVLPLFFSVPICAGFVLVGGYTSPPPPSTAKAAEAATAATPPPAAGAGTAQAPTSLAKSGATQTRDPQCPTWTYPEMTGATNNWAAAGCRACTESSRDYYQSPILLQRSAVAGTSPTDLTPPNLTLTLSPQREDNNYAFKVDQPLTINSLTGPVRYTWTFEGFHFHVPAEHVLMGQLVSVMEMHVKAKGTYTSPSGNGTDNGVFAVQFAVSSDPSTPTWLRGVANAMAGQPNQTFEITTALRRFQTEPAFFYMGSLTTPPCSGRVLFFVLQSPLLVDLASWRDIASSLTTLNHMSNVRPLKATPAGATQTLLLPRR